MDGKDLRLPLGLLDPCSALAHAAPEVPRHLLPHGGPFRLCGCKPPGSMPRFPCAC